MEPHADGTRIPSAEVATYLRLADLVVPNRDEQLATLISLIPIGVEERFNVLELGCGDGTLMSAVLSVFPNAEAVALDGATEMLDLSRRNLAPFADRVSVQQFDLRSKDWLRHLDRADIVLSSLVIHHLPDSGKRELFRQIAKRVSSRGAVLIADVIATERPEARKLFAEQIDRWAISESTTRSDGDQLLREYREDGWNCHARTEFPPTEFLAPLLDQLEWIREAGFVAAGCFWLRGGFAVFGGYRSPSIAAGGETTNFSDALRVVRQANKVLR